MDQVTVVGQVVIPFEVIAVDVLQNVQNDLWFPDRKTETLPMHTAFVDHHNGRTVRELERQRCDANSRALKTLPCMP